MKNEHASQNAAYAAIAALCMLGFGWFNKLSGISSDKFYNTTVELFSWTLRIGGFAMLAVAVLCFASLRVGLLVDVFVSGICGAIIAGCALYWLVHGFAGGGFDPWDLLYLIFGGMFLNAAKSCWISYTATAPPTAPGGDEQRAPQVVPVHSKSKAVPAETPQPEEPVHPASIRPTSMDANDDPPPGGYLAALAREQDKPPQADFE